MRVEHIITRLLQLLPSSNIPPSCHLQSWQMYHFAQVHPASLACTVMQTTYINNLVLDLQTSAWAGTAVP